MKSFRTGIANAIQSAMHKRSRTTTYTSPWEAAACLPIIRCGDAMALITLNDCGSVSHSYVIEVSNADGVIALMHSGELGDTLDALLEARDAIERYERTFLED